MALINNQTPMTTIAARNLNAFYSTLSVSTRRLSSNLEINNTPDSNARSNSQPISKEEPAFILDLSKNLG